MSSLSSLIVHVERLKSELEQQSEAREKHQISFDKFQPSSVEQHEQQLVTKDKQQFAKVQTILKCLQSLPMTIPLLQRTMIAKSVQKWKYDLNLGPLARMLLKQWKAVVKTTLSSSTTTPSSKTTATKIMRNDLKKNEPKSKKSKETANKKLSNTKKTASNNTITKKTVVCNVRVNCIRPQYKNLQEWMNDSSHNAYIGRRGIVFINKKRFPTKDSAWANPYKITKMCSREQVLEQYEQYLRQRLREEPTLEDELLRELDGKRLGCWCHPNPCHGDILVRMMEEIKKERKKRMNVDPTKPIQFQKENDDEEEEE